MRSTNHTTHLAKIAQERTLRGTGLLEFGVELFDDGFYGISRFDVIIAGAYPGAGKTELVTSIATHNVKLGKRVFFLALEAELYEIENRILFKLMMKYFLQDENRPKVNVRYSAWLHGHLPELVVYDTLAENEFKNDFTTLHTMYLSSGFSIHDFRQEFLEISNAGADLIIIDHAHYFDFGDQQENSALKEVITTIRDLNIESGIPMILVSHLRKRDFKNNFYAPTLEDFHGSSELYKKATKAITLGSGLYDPQSAKIETYANMIKCRFEGEVTKVTGKLIYSFKENKYENKYQLGKPDQKRDKEFELLDPSDYPSWSRYKLGRNYNSNVSKIPSIPENKGWKGYL